MFLTKKQKKSERTETEKKQEWKPKIYWVSRADDSICFMVEWLSTKNCVTAVGLKFQAKQLIRFRLCSAFSALCVMFVGGVLLGPLHFSAASQEASEGKSFIDFLLTWNSILGSATWGVLWSLWGKQPHINYWALRLVCLTTLCF